MSIERAFCDGQCLNNIHWLAVVQQLHDVGVAERVRRDGA